MNNKAVEVASPAGAPSREEVILMCECLTAMKLGPCDEAVNMLQRLLKSSAGAGEHPKRLHPSLDGVPGVLFGFMGYLTSREERLVLSSRDDAAPAVKAIEEYAEKMEIDLEAAPASNPKEPADDFKRGAREGWMRALVAYVDLHAEGNQEYIAGMEQRWPLGKEPADTAPVQPTDAEIAEIVEQVCDTHGFDVQDEHQGQLVIDVATAVVRRLAALSSAVPQNPTPGSVHLAEPSITATDTSFKPSQPISNYFIDRLLEALGEMPDRDSPSDFPGAYVVTGKELREYIRMTEERFAENEHSTLGPV